MKKIVQFVFIVLYLIISTEMKAQNGIIVYSKDTLCFNTRDLVDISHDMLDNPVVLFACKDTTITRDVLSVDSIVLEKIPDCLYLKEDIGDWSDMAIYKDGSILMTKMKDNNVPIELAMMCPNDSLGTILTDIKFDENEYPVEIIMNEYKFLLNWINEETISLTVITSDSISIKYDSLSVARNLARERMRKVPAVDRKPWQTRLGGALQMIGGVATVGVGVVVGFSTTATGALSIPGAIIGGVIVADGLNSIRNGFINTFSEREYVRTGLIDVGQTLFLQGAIEGLQRVPQHTINILEENGINYRHMLQNIQMSELPRYTARTGLLATLVSLMGGLVSDLGRPFTWADLVATIRENVRTGISMDITSCSATLRGYISPYILESPHAKFETEYGIVVYSASDPNDRQSEKFNNGDGGMIECSFSNLKPGTKYNYQTYYIDKTNQICVLSDPNTFTTLFELPVITKFEVTNAQYQKDAFTNDGLLYDYRFDVAVTVELKDDYCVEDWGYVYEDPDGRTKEVSLKTFGTTYTDSRYAYFRNEKKSSACLYTYIKYEGNNILYGEPKEYDLIYENQELPLCPDANHPHWIDLGLPSGTLWRCCNEGASAPEDHGGFYAFGEVASAPTREQIYELTNYKTYVWTRLNDIYGMKFTGPNGGTIFLPAAGMYGNYWSSTPYSENYFWYWQFSSHHIYMNYFGFEPDRRLSVRPVR